MQLSEIQKISAPEEKRFYSNTCDEAEYQWGYLLFKYWLEKTSPIQVDIPLGIRSNEIVNGVAIYKNDKSFGAQNYFILQPYVGFLANTDCAIRRPILRQIKGYHPEAYQLKQDFLEFFQINHKTNNS